MESITLSLRQRKLLNLIQNQTTHITGQAFAKQLNVSPRTIRSDIAEINRHLAPCNAKIAAEKGKGYYLECTDPIAFRELFKTDDLLLTREDRIRYLAFQLCLSEIPLNQYDLEDEMYVSKTTLENDIATLKSQYTLAPPHLRLIHEGDTWMYEADEVKRRDLLNHLFLSDWDYNAAGNAYYDYNFLNDDIMNMIMAITSRLIIKFNFQIEDSNLVSLNLALAIMYYRIKSGHVLPEIEFSGYDSGKVFDLCEELFETLEQSLSCNFPFQERVAVYKHLHNSHLLDAGKLNFQTVSKYFDPDTLLMADSYLELINTTFRIDLTPDEDFYITLLQFIRHIKTPGHTFNNSQGNPNLIRRTLLMESELAYLFQKIAKTYMGCRLDETELLYLALCISGALEAYWTNHPENRIRTVICCHLNLPAIWAMKRKILSSFDNYINVTALIPVNARNAYDFSDTDLVLTTVKKRITDNPSTHNLQVSPDITAHDHSKIQQLVLDLRLKSLFKGQEKSLTNLLPDAYWHEDLQATGRFPIIEYLAQDFINDELVTSDFLVDLLRRESTYTFGFQPGALFLYSLVPARKTKLSIATLKHRVLWNSSKIRVIFMACFAPSEKNLLLKLLQEIYINHNHPDYLRKERSRAELLQFYSQEMPETEPETN